MNEFARPVRSRNNPRPIRKCRTVHQCNECGQDIVVGERYLDGGYGNRTHVECPPHLTAHDVDYFMDPDGDIEGADFL